MKIRSIKLFLALLSTVFTFEAYRLHADDSVKVVDVREMLKRADTILFQDGVTKIISEHPETGANGGKWTFTKYCYKNKEGDKFTYVERMLVSSIKTFRGIRISRPDGHWTLYSGAAIHEPEDMNISDNIVYNDSKPVMGSVEDFAENGMQCIRIEIILPPDNKDKSRHNSQTQYIRRYIFFDFQRQWSDNRKACLYGERKYFL